MIASRTDQRPYQFAASHDRQVQAAAIAALRASNYVGLRNLTCQVQDGVVEISGQVASYYLKQLAQTSVLPLSPIGSVRNLVEVSQ
jgi:osmotically-inducible protein OsmY